MVRLARFECLSRILLARRRARAVLDARQAAAVAPQVAPVTRETGSDPGLESVRAARAGAMPTSWVHKGVDGPHSLQQSQASLRKGEISAQESPAKWFCRVDDKAQTD